MGVDRRVPVRPLDVLAVTVVGLLLGLPIPVRPYPFARLEERIDAIGRTPSGRVEPAGWKVTLTRVAGVVMVAAGAGSDCP